MASSSFVTCLKKTRRRYPAWLQPKVTSLNTTKQTAKSKITEDGTILTEGDRSRWFTNLGHDKRNIPIDLYKRYSNEEYPKYDNYDAIEVSKVADIPEDYDGVMGVPITFLDKYCPTQFEIVGLMNGAKDNTLINGDDGRAKFYVSGKGVYARILIKKLA